tara:strand:+ start:79 stop:180 length:102 start_codon:yes stop_codon:yes gene_type:complete
MRVPSLAMSIIETPYRIPRRLHGIRVVEWRVAE